MAGSAYGRALEACLCCITPAGAVQAMAKTAAPSASMSGNGEHHHHIGLGPWALAVDARHAGDPLHQRHPRNSAMVKTDMARPVWLPGRTSARPHTAAPCSPTAPHRQRAATSSHASCHAHGRKRCRHRRHETGKASGGACRGRGPCGRRMQAEQRHQRHGRGPRARWRPACSRAGQSAKAPAAGPQQHRA